MVKGQTHVIQSVVYHSFSHQGGSGMSDMLKVIEVLAESDKSWEDAAAQAVTRASKSVHGIKSIYIKDMEAKVEKNKITKYRINANISFMLD
jgi:flavin-binding protein dodecin